MQSELTAALARSLLHYNSESGELVWKPRKAEHFVGKHQPEAVCARWNARCANKRAGRPSSSGHLKTTIFGRNYLVHRLVYLVVVGRWPEHFIDHINLNPQDNRWSNLRDATNSQNHANTRISRSNKSGAKGVTAVQRKSGVKWRASIRKGKTFHLGLFDTFEEAVEAYKNGAEAHFGSFARTIDTAASVKVGGCTQ